MTYEKTCMLVRLCHKLLILKPSKTSLSKTIEALHKQYNQRVGSRWTTTLLTALLLMLVNILDQAMWWKFFFSAMESTKTKPQITFSSNLKMILESTVALELVSNLLPQLPVSKMEFLHILRFCQVSHTIWSTCLGTYLEYKLEYPPCIFTNVQKHAYLRYKVQWKRWLDLSNVMVLYDREAFDREKRKPTTWVCAINCCKQPAGLWMPWYAPGQHVEDDAPRCASINGSTGISKFIDDHLRRDANVYALMNCERVTDWHQVHQKPYSTMICVTCSTRCYRYARNYLAGLLMNPIVIRGTAQFVEPQYINIRNRVPRQSTTIGIIDLT